LTGFNRTAKDTTVLRTPHICGRTDLCGPNPGETMPGVNHTYLTDDDMDRIKQRARSLSPFDTGDRVTVEPTDHGVPYVGDELEGQPLTINGVTVRDGLHYYNPEKHEARTHLSAEQRERRLVEVDGLLEQEHVGSHPHIDYSHVYLSQIQHTFETNNWVMSVSSLISWDEFRTEYNHPIVLDADNDSHKSKRTLLQDADGTCEVCGCTKILVSGTDDDVLGWYGTTSCPACGTVFERVDP